MKRKTIEDFCGGRPGSRISEGSTLISGVRQTWKSRSSYDLCVADSDRFDNASFHSALSTRQPYVRAAPTTRRDDRRSKITLSQRDDGLVGAGARAFHGAKSPWLLFHGPMKIELISRSRVTSTCACMCCMCQTTRHDRWLRYEQDLEDSINGYRRDAGQTPR